MTTYRAVRASVEGEFELELTEPGPGQVRIAVEACGVCHSGAARFRMVLTTTQEG